MRKRSDVMLYAHAILYAVIIVLGIIQELKR